MANELKTEKKAQAVSMLCEGTSALDAVRVSIVAEAKKGKIYGRE